MIILLGPDNTGKSTLAEQLAEIGAHTFHCTTFTDYSNYITFLSDPSLQDTVFDRWFFCDIPYAKVVRGEAQSKFTYQQVQIMNRFTSMYKPLILLCTHQADNFADREQLSTQDQHTALLLDYKRVLAVLHQPYIVYDWENPFMSPEELLQEAARLYKPVWLTYPEDTPV